MEHRQHPLEERLAGLEMALAAVEGRLQRLETVAAGLPPKITDTPLVVTAEDLAGEAAVSAEPSSPLESHDVAAVLSLMGRTLLTFAGAYLLRALTSTGQLPQVLGAILGLAYAAGWLLFADRAAARGRRLSAAFHGATAVLVAIPLVWETTVRFAVLTPPVAVGALALFTGLGLTVAVRHRLGFLAWSIALLAGVDALMMGPPTHAPVPFTLFLVALGVTTLWLARLRHWTGLPWATALLVDLAILELTGPLPIERGWATFEGVVLAELVFFTAYVACFVILERRGHFGPTLFAALQTLVALVLGFGGAVSLLRRSPTLEPVLGGITLLLAFALYVLGLVVVDREKRRSVFYYTSLALPLALIGSDLLVHQPAVLWSLAAVVAAWAGGRWERYIASLHAILFVLAAFIVSGLLAGATTLWLRPPEAWSPLGGEALAAVAAAIVCLSFRRHAAPVEGHWYAAVPGCLSFALVVWGGGALLLAALGSSLGTDPALLATLRTAVLAAAALMLAAASRLPGLREGALLVYPLLFFGAVELLVDDLPNGRASTLALAFALYGTALILAPRLRWRRGAVAPEERASG